MLFWRGGLTLRQTLGLTKNQGRKKLASFFFLA